MMDRGMGGMVDGCPIMGDMMGGMRGQNQKGRGKMHSRPMMEARLAFTKAGLEVTETQMEAWDAYVDAVRKRRESMVA